MTALIQAKAWQAILGRINQWSDTAVMLPDTVFTPQADESWIGVQPVGLSPVERGIQYGCGNEFTGFININIMVPVGWTYGQHAGLAAKVCDFFPHGARYAYDDAAVTIHERPYIDGAPRLDAAWNRLDVRISWRAWG